MQKERTENDRALWTGIPGEGRLTDLHLFGEHLALIPRLLLKLRHLEVFKALLLGVKEGALFLQMSAL